MILKERLRLEEINKEGKISWIDTTLDQRHLYIVFPSHAALYSFHKGEFDVLCQDENREYRVYGTNLDKFIVIDPVKHEVKTSDHVYKQTSSGILDCWNDVHLIPLEDSPPITGMRIVSKSIYILITLPRSQMMKLPATHKYKHPAMMFNM